MAQAQDRPGPGPRPRIPFVAPIESRDGTLSKDARLVNCYAEKQPDGSYQIYRRPGLAFAYSSGTTGFGHDMQTTGYGTVFAVGAQIFALQIGAVVNLGTAPGPVGYQAVGLLPYEIVGSGSPGVFVVNGNRVSYSPNLAVGSLTAVPTASTSWYPLAISRRAVVLDYTFYVTPLSGGAQVYGSNVGDPTTWPALNAESVGIDVGWAVGLAKQLGYVAVLKTFDTEICYDAGTSPTPLAPIPQMKISSGCVNEYTISTNEGKTFWIAQGTHGGVFPMMMENGQAQRIGTAPVDKVFASWNGFAYAGTQFQSVRSWSARLNGHLFYGVTSIPDNQTLVYDASEGLWSQWTDANGNYFPITGAGGIAQAGAGPGETAAVYALHATNGNVYYMSSQYGTDVGVPFEVDIYTPNEDFGVATYKVCNRMQLITDVQKGVSVFVRWNDYDYDPAKWSDFREFDLSERSPFTSNCGRFRRRAWHIRYKSLATFRLESVELNLSGGSK